MNHDDVCIIDITSELQVEISKQSNTDVHVITKLLLEHLHFVRSGWVNWLRDFRKNVIFVRFNI